MRSLAREIALKILFSKLFDCNDGELFDVICNEEKLSNIDKNFAKELLNFESLSNDKHLSCIEKLVKGYKLSRVYNVDKCILLLGMTEIDNYKDTDLPIIFDEYVKLAGKYSTEKSTDFINGILAEYAIGERGNG